MQGRALTPEDFAAALGVSRETLDRFRAYAALLEKWQSAINLVGRDSLADPWRRHFLDSAQLANLIPADARTITDLGSGAGFPGLVIAIVLGRPVHLIESSGKKAAFLREAARETEADVEIHQARIEAVTPWETDVITARALAPLPLLLSYAEPFCGPGTLCLFPKGARTEQELTEAGKSWKMALSRHQSASDPKGVILSIRNLARDG